jgi:cell division protein FtsQ
VTGADGRRWRLVRAGPDAVPASVRRFMRTARRRRGRRPAPWTVVATAVVVAALAGWLLWAGPVFAVQRVEVRGTSLLAEAEVRERAAVAELTPLLRVPTDEVAARVAELGPVARVEVRRDWPDTVVIEVVERVPVAAVPADGAAPDPAAGGFHLLDATGLAFLPVAARPADLPVLVLAEVGPDTAATRAALTVLVSLTPRLRADLDTLTVAGPARIRLALRSGRTVVWGDETASDEKARVATALLDRAAAVIDVSAPEVVVLR